MYQAVEQFAELNQANIEQVTRLAAVVMQHAEKVFNANVAMAKFALTQNVESAAAAAAVNDVQDLLAIRAKYTETGVQRALGYSRNLYEIARETQAQCTGLAEQAFVAYTQRLISVVEHSEARPYSAKGKKSRAKSSVLRK